MLSLITFLILFFFCYYYFLFLDLFLVLISFLILITLLILIIFLILTTLLVLTLRACCKTHATVGAAPILLRLLSSLEELHISAKKLALGNIVRLTQRTILSPYQYVNSGCKTHKGGSNGAMVD